jgi:2-polyprenyl-3-methyl-5-hydroxy-6-metoxy-1,4-benzoquinol methylase
MGTDWRDLAERTADEFVSAPVTAEDLDGPASEINYLKNLRFTHVDTIQRVGERLAALQQPNPRVLEIGAYYGVVSVALARAGVSIVAQDASSILDHPRLLQRYLQERVELMPVADVSQPLPYESATFDALICCEVLEHLPFNTVRLLREVRRIVKPGGFVFLAVPNQASAKRRLQLLLGHPIREAISSWISSPLDDNWHWREYVASEFHELLRGCGFHEIDLRFRHYTPPAHRNPIRRACLNLLYSVKPDLMDNIFAFAS